MSLDLDSDRLKNQTRMTKGKVKVCATNSRVKENSALSTTMAAIDVGSNAIRLVIGEVDPYGEVKIVKKVREPVRLGKDVFATGEISAESRQKALHSFSKFREIMREHAVSRVKAVGTSALREARDRTEFIEQIKRATGISVEVIDGIEEGRLIFSAVSHRVDLEEKVSLLIDIGGGSCELTIADHGLPQASQSFKIGTVRLLQILTDRGLKERDLPAVINDLFAPARSFLEEQLRLNPIDQAIGTGGNFECLGKLRVALLQKSSIFSMSRDELQAVANHLASMTVKERIQYLRLRPDRADVVVPAALLTLAVMNAADVDVLMVPYVGLRDGILGELSNSR